MNLINFMSNYPFNIKIPKVTNFKLSSRIETLKFLNWLENHYIEYTIDNSDILKINITNILNYDYHTIIEYLLNVEICSEKDLRINFNDILVNFDLNSFIFRKVSNYFYIREDYLLIDINSNYFLNKNIDIIESPVFIGKKYININSLPKDVLVIDIFQGKFYKCLNSDIIRSVYYGVFQSNKEQENLINVEILKNFKSKRYER